MLEYFREMIRKQHPDFMISFDVASAEQLSVITCKYCRGNVYYVARSFFTDTWISDSPLGPMKQKFHQSGDACLKDIATLIEFSDKQACMNFHNFNAVDIYKMLDELRKAMQISLDQLFTSNEHGDVFSYKLLVAPYPSIVVTVRSATELVGTMLIVCSGFVLPCFVCNGRLLGYVVLLRSRSNFWSPRIQLIGQEDFE